MIGSWAVRCAVMALLRAVATLLGSFGVFCLYPFVLRWLAEPAVYATVLLLSATGVHFGANKLE